GVQRGVGDGGSEGLGGGLPICGLQPGAAEQRGGARPPLLPPLRHLRRLAICVFSFFCIPFPPDEPRNRGRRYTYRYSLSSSSASSSSSDEYDSAGAGRTICVRPEYFVRACFIDLDLESLEKMVYCHELDQKGEFL
ncbi:unnamed protein product, partial [Musa acuminata subsp. burmannicoides]